jgi:hypothetical protein
MTKRILLAGLLGGLALFFWGGLSHMVLGLGEVGVQTLPQAQPVIDSLKASVSQPGFYLFPWDASGKLAPEKENGPYGVLIYHPTGATTMMTVLLVRECILNILQALVAAFLLSLATGLKEYPSRVGFVLLLGLISAAGTNIEYWNWYGFPTNYTAATVLDKLIGFLVVGLITAALVKSSAGGVQMASAKAA